MAKPITDREIIAIITQLSFTGKFPPQISTKSGVYQLGDVIGPVRLWLKGLCEMVENPPTTLPAPSEIIRAGEACPAGPDAPQSTEELYTNAKETE